MTELPQLGSHGVKELDDVFKLVFEIVEEKKLNDETLGALVDALRGLDEIDDEVKDIQWQEAVALVVVQVRRIAPLTTKPDTLLSIADILEKVAVAVDTVV